MVVDGAGWWLISLGLVLRAVGGHSAISTQKRLHGKTRAGVVYRKCLEMRLTQPHCSHYI